MTRQRHIFYNWSSSDSVWPRVLDAPFTKHTPSDQRSHWMSSKTGTMLQIPGWLSVVYLWLTADGTGCQQSAASLPHMLAGVLAADERVLVPVSHLHLFRVEPAWLTPDVTFDPSAWVLPQLTCSTTRWIYSTSNAASWSSADMTSG